MAFNAGAVTGTLGIDANPFTRSMLEAQGLMQLFPSWVTNFMANPLLGMADVFSQLLSFSTIKEIGRQFDDMGESAQKAGVAVQFLTGLQAVAADAGGSAEAVAGSFKFLNKNIGEALDTTSQSSAALRQQFQQLGISAELLGSGNTQAIFLQLADGMAKIENPAVRTNVAMGLLGRGAEDMLLVLGQGSAGIQKSIQIYDTLGATVTEAEAVIGDKVGTLSSIFGAAISGIQQEASRPILQFLADHAAQITDGIVAASGYIRGALGSIFEFIANNRGLVLGVLGAFAAVAGAVLIPIIGSAVAAVAALAPPVSAATAAIVAIVAAMGGLAASGQSSALMATLAQTFNEVYAIGVQFADFFTSTVLPAMGPMWAKAVAVSQPLLEGVGAVLSAVLIPTLQTLFTVSKVGFAAWSGYMSVLLTALKPVADLVGWLLKQFAALISVISSASSALGEFVGVNVPAPGTSAAATTAAGSEVNINAPVTVGSIDSAETAKRIAAAVQPGIEKAAEEQRRSVDAAAAAAKLGRGRRG